MLSYVRTDVVLCEATDVMLCCVRTDVVLCED